MKLVSKKSFLERTMSFLETLQSILRLLSKGCIPDSDFDEYGASTLYEKITFSESVIKP